MTLRETEHDLEATIDIDREALDRHLDLARFSQLLLVTPKAYGQLTAVERRLLLRAAEGLKKRFTEITRWMGKIPTPEQPTPFPLTQENQSNV